MIKCDILIAGSGIAGLTAALTGARLGLRTCLTGAVLGGQLLSINRIDGYPGFPDGFPATICARSRRSRRRPRAPNSPRSSYASAKGRASGADATDDGRDNLTRGVLATGAGLKELGIPGEERLRGKGVSHCASCDAPLLGQGRGRGGRRRFRGAGGADPGRARVARDDPPSRRRAVGAAGLSRRVRADPKIEMCGNRRGGNHGRGEVTGVRPADGDGDRRLGGLHLYWPASRNGVARAHVALDDRRESRPMRRCARRCAACAAGAVRAGWPGRAALSAGEGAAAAIAIDRYLCDERGANGDT